MYAAAFIGDKIIDLAGWDQGPAAETSNLNISYSNQFQSVSYVGGTWGRQFWRPGSMATVSFDSRFSLVDYYSPQYQRWVSYFLLKLPVYLCNQSSCVFRLTTPYPNYGTKQVETQTGVGTVTGSGNVRVVVNSIGMDANGWQFDIPVNAGETASVWMDRVRGWLLTTAEIQMYFSAGGTGETVTLTRRSPYAVTDPNLNISIGGPGTTATGIIPTTLSSGTPATPLAPMNEITFYDANVSVAASQVGTSVLLNTSVTGRLNAP